jgi:arginine/lysine/ornithine decarboxylase
MLAAEGAGPALLPIPATAESLDHRRAPVLEALERCRATSEPARALAEAEALAADAWGADRSWFLVNGAAGGNHAFLLATLRPGDEVVVVRDAHRSLLTALILTGARPVWVVPRLHPDLQFGLGVEPAEVAAALDAHPRARLVVLASPTPWGVGSDVAAVAALAHDRGLPVYVDETWGAHLPFHPALPTPALTAGADAVVTSVHRLPGSLGQGALLLARRTRLDLERIATAVAMTRTTSPSFPMLAALDACRRRLVLDGYALLARTIALARQARERLAAIPGLSVLDQACLGGAALDPTRLVVDVGGLGRSGCEVAAALRNRFGIVPELSDLTGVVCLVPDDDTQRGVDGLVAAFADLAAECGSGAGSSWTRPRSSAEAYAPAPQALSPRAAYFAPSRRVLLARAVAEIAAEPVVPLPSGIPVIVPGEVICAEKVAYLRHAVAGGMRVCGTAGSGLATIAVVSGHSMRSGHFLDRVVA